MYRSPLSSVDSVVSELLTKEIHLQSYSTKGNSFCFKSFCSSSTL